jgi:hypothetical protein
MTDPTKQVPDAAKKHAKPPNAGKGRVKGTPNKTTALLKDAILKAAEAAGGPSEGDSPGGIVAYLELQAKVNPGPFLALLGKVLPLQVTGDGGGPVQVSVVRFTEEKP